jgi:4-hydroxybenzoate polyprenyltransferase
VGEGKVWWYFKLARPFTSLPALPGGLILYLTVNDVNVENIIVGLLIGLSLACVQAVGQIVNQVVDIELDRYVKPYRPLPQGMVGIDESLGLAFMLAMLGFASATLVSNYYTLSIPLNGFTTKQGFNNTTWSTTLSIPLNGFVAPLSGSTRMFVG